MSFKSVLKGIGKVALKVAPYAAMAIPGVGVPLGMAIKGGIGAAQGALGGGGLKGALIGGGLGAAGGALGGAGGVLSKIGPSSSVLSKIGAGTAGKIAGTGVAGKVGGILGSVASNSLGKGNKPLIDTNDFGPQSGGGWRDVLNRSVDAIPGAIASSRGIGPSSNGPSNSSAVPRDITQGGNAPGFQYNSNNPNLADSILAGRRNAVADQPFRSGYDITARTDPRNLQSPTVVIGHTPQIHSDVGPLNSRRKRQQPAY